MHRSAVTLILLQELFLPEIVSLLQELAQVNRGLGGRGSLYRYDQAGLFFLFVFYLKIGLKEVSFRCALTPLFKHENLGGLWARFNYHKKIE